ncbi:MAG TPA: hypothetical protein VE684_15210, partial [Crenalkalicoccus sp.]|nr:hypothetical protein [Crenalkalicoccus sp.]
MAPVESQRRPLIGQRQRASSRRPTLARMIFCPRTISEFSALNHSKTNTNSRVKSDLTHRD